MLVRLLAQIHCEWSRPRGAFAVLAASVCGSPRPSTVGLGRVPQPDVGDGAPGGPWSSSSSPSASTRWRRPAGPSGPAADDQLLRGLGTGAPRPDLPAALEELRRRAVPPANRSPVLHLPHNTERWTVVATLGGRPGSQLASPSLPAHPETGHPAGPGARHRGVTPVESCPPSPRGTGRSRTIRTRGPTSHATDVAGQRSTGESSSAGAGGSTRGSGRWGGRGS